MKPAILITQCLQNDFVQSIGRYDSLPNLLHVGYDEARRLLGENPDEGSVARIMHWAYIQSDDALKLIHIRDWHDPSDSTQKSHLEQFGEHCIKETEGAEFVFHTPDNDKDVPLINSLTLNDFQGTNLEAVLTPYFDQPLRVGLIGVWTEAKITFLAYELRSRYPQFQLAICSALTASSSRGQHFIALDQLQKILGVTVIPSVGQFIEFLGGESEEMPLIGFNEKQPEIETKVDLSPTDIRILRYLFRDSRSLRVHCLDGGFSGNVVLGSESTDIFGHRQVPHVIKIGPQELIGQERAAFERIESVLGNSAPRITDFVDLEDRGGIKYRYASMGGGFSSTFQKLYMEGIPLQKIKRILNTVFSEQLGRFYAAGSLEKSDLLDYYCFSSHWVSSVQKKVAALLSTPIDGEYLNLPGEQQVYNICRFYEQDLDSLPNTRSGSNYFSYIHGDLNGANIIIDSHENVWIIDFYHTHRGHILKDLIKLENDLLYIFTAISNENELQEAYQLTDALMAISDLAKPLPEARFQLPQLQRVYDTICHLRTFYPELIHSDRSPLQLWIGQMRYAVHTLSFDESNHWQRLWALYTAGRCAQKVVDSYRQAGPLRINWMDTTYTAPGKMGLTILPGRRDYNRNLETDLQTLIDEGITHVVCLLSHSEFTLYGVDDLLDYYRYAGFLVCHLPIKDQSMSSQEEMQSLIRWISEELENGAQILLHCVGGLGRSGTAAACYLRAQGLTTEAAIAEIRRIRSPRAIETTGQEQFVEQFSYL